MKGAGRLRALLALDLIALLFTVSFAAITAPAPAERALGRSVAILTEVDTYVDGHFPALQQEAVHTDQTRLTLPDFPVAVSFTPQEIQHADRDRFRALLLARSATVLHNEGTSAFLHGRPRQAGYGSPEGAIRAGMDLFRPVPHRVFVGLAIALGLMAALLALALAAQGDAPLQTIGVSAVVASGVFLALAVAVRVVFHLASLAAGDELVRGFLDLAEQLTWAPIRDGLIVMVGSAALAAAGAALPRRTAEQEI